ncbi:BCCT family transporter [Salisediminibacterium selenitireducens]|uniref:Choline/carnitine/betaine transporter n=1 Tax=Bacillus selenitireducens (strain ATCC 700615 / DSM 15326 / MLS10) TaxID=439292 RepID=D6XXI7_BACIE|nr:BCCT family transporter [Salisediminibacterium selenitireducens]ADH98044.1 choline/carnitine/betaine transporter [[Bacillus] selenitireducens MLS10]
MEKYSYETKNPNIVFYISAPIVLAFVLWGLFFPENLANVSSVALAFTLDNFGWFYMLVTAFFIAFVLFLAISPFGKLKLGKPDEKPEFRFFSWLGMLFAAGIGVGFVFWGVAEPILYYYDPHPDYIGQSDAVRAEAGLRYGVFHWALHPWAIFSLVALTLAYVQFRKDQPALISSAFQPILGDRAYGGFGKAIDVLAVLATSTGVATTFGLSALQITGGLSYLVDWIPNNATVNFIIIAIVTFLFIFSAATGVDKGIKILSTTNLILAGLLLFFVIIVGPTLFIAQNFVSVLGNYMSNVVQMSFDLNPFGDGEWLGNNTIFFWAWHISWAPFMGIFIARISRGRTIREFVAGVLIVPSLLGALWFTTFGGTGLSLIMGGNDEIGDLVMNEVELALFATLGELPISMITSVIAVILILIFFITSADSASYVLGAMTSQGSLSPKLTIKVIWGFLIAGTASVLLISGGLEGLQTASIVAALPFAMIMVVMVFSLLIMMTKDMKKDKIKTQRKQTKRVKDEVYGGMKDEFYDEFREEAYDEMKEEVYGQMKEEVYDDFKDEVYDEFKDETYDRVKDEVYEQMKEEAYEDFKGEAYDKVKEEVYEQVKDEVYDDIKEEVYEEFKEKIYEDLRDDLGEQLNGELESPDDEKKDK